MAEFTTLKASCLCGDTKFHVDIPNASLPIDAHMCHCSRCRRTHGTLCVFHAMTPIPSTLEGMSTYKASPESIATRYFCPKCGTHMGDTDSAAKEWCASTTVFDKSEGIFNFKNHIFVPATKDGGFAEWLPQIGEEKLRSWEGHQYETPELGPDWKGSVTSTKEPSKTTPDRLHVHCQCNGVSFYISRPDYNSPAFKSDFPGMPMPSQNPLDRSREDESWWIATDRSKYFSANCVCRSCRLGSGAEVVQWAFVPSCFVSQEDGSPFARTFGTLKEYNSSEDIWRRFCGTCGAVVFWHDHKDRPNCLDIAVGLLDSDSGARAEDWLEWRGYGVSNQQGALHKPLAEALYNGLMEWGNETGHERPSGI